MPISFEARQRKNKKYNAKRDKVKRAIYFKERKQRPDIKAHTIAYHREYRKRTKLELADVHVVKEIVAMTGLATADIPQELIKLKREQLRLNRLIKEGK